MNIITVQNKSDIKKWLEFPLELYKGDENYIHPLNNEVEDVFDKSKNKLFKDGDAVRFLLIENGKVLGRIAAFFNNKLANKGNKQPTGGIGFFECINNKEIAFQLFETAKEWLESKGMQAMDGPINFGDRDRFWGLLTDGFYPPNYGMFYHKEYYQQFFEDFGFKVYFNQYTYYRIVKGKEFEKRFYDKAKLNIDNPDYSFRYPAKDEMDKLPEYFVTVYNKAWAGHSGVKAMDLRQAKMIFKKLKPIMDRRLLYFGFYKGEPISFYISIPDINQIFRKFKGKFGLIQKLLFLYYQSRGIIDKSLGLVFGVVPQHQGKGIEAAMVVSYSDLAFSEEYEYITTEMNWIGDFNPKMMRVVEQIGGEILKTHKTYRYLFDRNAEFERMPFN
ncbi:hypothetical protein [Marinigracilibium pacificum]|uniref:N-acetyltransferase domain-containing protein n=1 Tax=Marinigracilibium pacificum TaxID=2729599 RepID=A0A848IYD2_9BACT|nr:hypothetical protein [Marinigracilibium pacificum]NMM47254.1 hypothetical protein [Marinigracilibium pacificum]